MTPFQTLPVSDGGEVAGLPAAEIHSARPPYLSPTVALAFQKPDLFVLKPDLFFLGLDFAGGG